MLRKSIEQVQNGLWALTRILHPDYPHKLPNHAAFAPFDQIRLPVYWSQTVTQSGPCQHPPESRNRGWVNGWSYIVVNLPPGGLPGEDAVSKVREHLLLVGPLLSRDVGLGHQVADQFGDLWVH